MKIVVCVKQVAALDDEFELLDDGGGVDPDFLELDLNEWDAFSLEAALELAEQESDVEVVAVTVGDEASEEALLGCMARGADRAVRVSDEGLTMEDPLTVARVLAAAVAREAADLVLCGVQSSDAVNSATGIAVAGFLDLPHVAVVKGLQYDAAQSTATVERELEGGVIERLRVRTPALLTIQTGINQPRYANLRAIKQAKEKPLEVVSADELGVDEAQRRAAAGSHRRSLNPPDRGATAEMIEGGAAEVAARIAEIVRDRTAA